MTSEKYFLKWVKEAGRGHIVAFLSWGTLAGYALMTMVRLGLSTESCFFGIGSQELLWICAGLGAALSFLEFFYLMQPKKLDFYYGLPVRKGTIFWGRYVHGILHFAAPLVLVMTACGLFEANLDVEFLPYSSSYTGHSILMSAAVFLVFYHMGILFLSVCGNILPAILGYALCLNYGHILIGNVFVTWVETNYHTYYRIPLLETLDIVLSPLFLAEHLTGQNLFDKLEVFEHVPSALYVISAAIWILFPFLLFSLAQKKRKTERVGRMFAVPLAERAAFGLLSFLAGVWGGSLFTELSGFSQNPLAGGAANVLVGVMAAAALHCLLEWGAGNAGGKSRGKILRRKWQLALECAAVVLTGLVFFVGASSFDAFLPEVGEVEEIGVSIAGLDMNYAGYMRALGKGEQYETERQLDKYVLKEEGKDAAFAWIMPVVSKNGAIEGGADEGAGGITRVTVRYRMKDGREVYRQYSIDEEDLQSFAFVYDTAEYKNIAYLAGRSRRVSDARFTWSDGVTDTILKLTDEEKEALLDAYEKDVESMGMEELRTSLPIGFVQVTSEVPYYSNQMVVYPFFAKTCGLLEEYGAEPGKGLPDYSVRSISVVSVEGKGVGRKDSRHYEKPDEIEAWIGDAVLKDFDLQPLLFPLDYSREMKIEIWDETTSSTLYVDGYAAVWASSREK